MTKKYWVARTDELLCSSIESETLIYDLKTDKAHSLNKTASALWYLCDGARSIQDLAVEVKASTGEDLTEKDIAFGLAELAENDLIIGEVVERSISRRRMLKKTALAGAVALPLITSVVAPTAAQAQSLLPPGAPCQNSPQCANSQCVGIGGGAKMCRII